MVVETYERQAGLARAAARRFAPPPGLPAFFALTDPQRTPDPVALARALPPGSGLVLRHFGLKAHIALAGRLARIARQRRLVFLVANDPGLARRCGASGVHWPQAQAHRARVWARREPGWLQTASAHDRSSCVKPAAGIQAVFLSAVFESASPSAGPAIGLVLAQRWARSAQKPVYALGGVDQDTIDRLDASAMAGVCAVSARAAN